MLLALFNLWVSSLGMGKHLAYRLQVIFEIYNESMVEAFDLNVRFGKFSFQESW